MNPALLVDYRSPAGVSLSPVQRRYLIQFLGCHVVNHKLVAFRSKNYLSVAQPLRTEDLVHVVQTDRIFFEKIVGKYVPWAIFLIDFSNFASVRFTGTHVINEIERRSEVLLSLHNSLLLVVARLITDKILRLVRLAISFQAWRWSVN